MKFDFTVINKRQGNLPFIMDHSPFVIGRTDNCDFQLDSRTVSRQHCELKLKRAGLTVKDLGSRNGTLLNGESIPPDTRVVIRPGDLLQIGKYTVRFGAILQLSREESEDDSDSPAITTHHEKLMASLDDLVGKTVDSSSGLSAESPSRFDERAAVTWKSLQSPTAASDQSAKIGIDEASVSSSDEPVVDETVTVASDDETIRDDPEKLKLELRARLEALKSMDSKEAADRALKRLFGKR